MKKSNKECKFVIPREVLDLVRFLAQTWNLLEKTRFEAIKQENVKDFLILHWPVVQGTTNQLNLEKIGKQKYDSKKLHKAVEWMLKGLQ